MIFKQLIHPVIEDGYIISPDGCIKCDDYDSNCYTADYHSSNGYDYARFIIKKEHRINNNPIRLFPIDEIVALVYLPIPEELENKPRTIRHINGDTRDISLDNMEWVEDVEIWKPCVYPGIKLNMYEISNWGKVRNKISNNLINVYINHKGYLSVQIMRDNLSDMSKPKSKPVDVHRLIAYHFINGEINNNFVINHIDGNKQNPSIKNIEYVKQIDNVKHATATGLLVHANGERVNTSILTEKLVHAICELLQKSNGSIKYVMEHIPDVSYKSIYRIKNGETWKHISSKYDLYKFQHKSLPKRSKLTVDDVAKLCEILLITDGDEKYTVQIAYDNGLIVTKNFIHRLKNKYVYSEIGDKIFNKIFKNRLLDEDVELICKTLVKYNKDINKTVNELRDNPRINRTRILHILHRESHQDIYNKYFPSE